MSKNEKSSKKELLNEKPVAYGEGTNVHALKSKHGIKVIHEDEVTGMIIFEVFKKNDVILEHENVPGSEPKPTHNPIDLVEPGIYMKMPQMEYNPVTRTLSAVYD
jgi:hypothetical protein